MAPDQTQQLARVLPVAVQIILPVVAIISTWMAGKIRAKNYRIKQEQDHALALAAQQEDFDCRKKQAALARDKHLYDTQQQIIDQMQESQRDSAYRAARMDAKFNEL